MRSFLAELIGVVHASFVHYVRRPATRFINNLVTRLDTWARQETARALSDENEAPEVTAKRMGSVNRSIHTVHASDVHPHRSCFPLRHVPHVFVYVHRRAK